VGLHLDENLTWNDHVKAIKNKASSVVFALSNVRNLLPKMEFKEFEPRFKSTKIRFKFSAGLYLETFDTILSGTNHI